MPRMNQLSSYKTTISGDENWGVIVTYQSTQIVKVDQARGVIELCTHIREALFSPCYRLHLEHIPY